MNIAFNSGFESKGNRRLKFHHRWNFNSTYCWNRASAGLQAGLFLHLVRKFAHVLVDRMTAGFLQCDHELVLPVGFQRINICLDLQGRTSEQLRLTNEDTRWPVRALFSFCSELTLMHVKKLPEVELKPVLYIDPMVTV